MELENTHLPLLLFFIFLSLFFFVCVRMRARLWRSEDNEREPALSFHHIGPG